MPPVVVATEAMVPPAVALSVKVIVYWPTVAPPEAVSVTIIVHSFEAPVPGTVGANSMSRFCDLPRLSKYSMDRDSLLPSPVDSVAVAGRLMPSSIEVVGSPRNRLVFRRTGSSPTWVSRG